MDKITEFFQMLQGVYGQKYKQVYGDEQTFVAGVKVWGKRIENISEEAKDHCMTFLIEHQHEKRYLWPDVGTAVRVCEQWQNERRRKQRENGMVKHYADKEEREWGYRDWLNAIIDGIKPMYDMPSKYQDITARRILLSHGIETPSTWQ